jgi:hypothetical protein
MPRGLSVSQAMHGQTHSPDDCLTHEDDVDVVLVEQVLEAADARPVVEALSLRRTVRSCLTTMALVATSPNTVDEHCWE